MPNRRDPKDLSVVTRNCERLIRCMNDRTPPGVRILFGGPALTRHLVRNMLQIPWPGVNATGHQEPPSLLERRPLSVPSSAQAQRLRVVGWLQDRQGRLLAAAQSACLPELEDTASTPP